jgi:hypothetical protein
VSDGLSQYIESISESILDRRERLRAGDVGSETVYNPLVLEDGSMKHAVHYIILFSNSESSIRYSTQTWPASQN